MQAYYHYQHDENGALATTHCVVVNNQECAKGIAYCSEKDNFSRKVGRNIAFERARKALEIKRGLFGKPYIQDGQVVAAPFLRAVYMPYLQDREKRIMGL